jgi:putative aldouronate transport system substrate-binding protein
MRRSLVRLLGLLAALVMTAGMAACQSATPPAAPSSPAVSAAESAQPSGAAEADTSPITFTLYVGDYWQTNYIDPSWTDPIAVELTKRTGVTLDVSIPASDDDEGEMNKLIASGNLADFIFRSYGASKQTLASGGYVKALDDLIEQYGPNIKKNMSGSFAAWRNRSDGKIYNIGYWYFNRTVKPALNLQVNTLQMRYDILKDMGFAKLDRSTEGSMNSFITLADYYALLDQVKAKYPDMIPALVNPNNALDILYRGEGKEVLNGYIWENNAAVNYAFSEDAAWAMKEVNGFFQKGYANIDDTTTSDEARQALLADGKVFSSMGYAGSVANAQATLYADNDERRFVQFYLVKDSSVTNIYMNHAWGDAASGMHVNAKLDDAKTARAMQFLDYCCSDEGSLLVCSGVEGISYTMDDATGWYTPVDDVFIGFRNWDPAVLKRTGVGGWLDILPCIAGVAPNGHCYDINTEKCFVQDPWVLYNTSDWKHFADNWIISPYTELDLDSQADAVDADSKTGAYMSDRLSNIMLSKDASVIDGELAKLREQLKSDGYDALQQARTDNWMEIASGKDRTPEEINRTPDQLGQ